MKRYDKNQIRQIKAAIKACTTKSPTAKYSDIAEHLNSAGIQHLSKPAWQVVDIGNFVNRHMTRKRATTRRRKARAVVTPAEPRRRDDRIELATLVLAAHISDGEKKRMLSSLFMGA